MPCDSLTGKDKSLEGKTVVEIASQGIRAKAVESKKDSHLCHCLDWSLMVKCGTVVDFRVYGRSSPGYGNC